MERKLVIAAHQGSSGCAAMRELMDTISPIVCDWIDVESGWDDMVIQRKVDAAIYEVENVSWPLREGITLASLINSPSGEEMAVVCRAERSDIRGLFRQYDIRRTWGKVWLVGAGPGSADLLTQRAHQTLAHADVVYHDDLIDEQILALSSGAREYVGKRKGHLSHPQEAINEKLYRSVTEGKTVVRLKGGDPSIYGRSGEELDFLRRRFVPVEVVPGVTAASAGAAAGLFSLTQRYVSRSVAFYSAHGATTGEAISGCNKTIVYYMAASKTLEVCEDLVRQGVGHRTPVAFIHNAGAYNEACVLTNVGKMASIDVPSPVIIIVGDVAAFARVENKALFIGDDPWEVQVPEPVVHQSITETDFFIDRKPTIKPLDLSFFSAVIFGSVLTVESFWKIYGDTPSHLLFYTLNEDTREALLRKNVHPWRIVSLERRSKKKESEERECLVCHPPVGKTPLIGITI